MDDMIFKRTSVRSYSDKSISSEQIEKLMQAAMAAPSGCNAQPWEFLVIQNKGTMNKIMEIHPFSSMLKEAPLVIMVCADKEKFPSKVPNVELWPQDCSAATQNIMLEAADMGIGSVWLGVHPREELQKPLAKLFELPQNIIPFSLISLGYPKGDVTPKNKFDKNKVHFEKW